MDDANDIVYLNVGGTKMATKRSTLCQIEGSPLAAMMSGRWEGRIEHDEDGHIFLDYNPKLFASVLDYLRAKRFETLAKPAVLPTVAFEDTLNFRSLIDYLCLEHTTPYTTRTSAADTGVRDEGEFQFDLCSAGIELHRNGNTAKHTLKANSHEFVLGANEVSTPGEGRWRFYLESAEANSKLFVGVLDAACRNSCVSESLTERENYVHVTPVHQWNGTYGWVLGEDFKTCSNGHVLNTHTYGPLGKQGDTIELGILTKTSDVQKYTNTHVYLLIQPSGVRRSIPLPNFQAWQCVIGSYHAGDCISLLS